MIIEINIKNLCVIAKLKNDEKRIKSIKTVRVLFIVRNAKKNELFLSSTFCYFL